MTLEVLISTYGNEGIARVAEMNLPTADNIFYLISWQMPSGDPLLPKALLRKDVRVSVISSTGLSKNRNNAIGRATGDICLIADDDVAYTAERLQAVVSAFVANSGVDIAAFRYDGDGKLYPDFEFDLRRPAKGWNPSSIEIAFRRETVAGKIEFNELFGLGAPEFHAAEEAVFIHQAMHRGLKGRFFPVTIARHNGASTGFRRMSKGFLMAQGAYMSIAYPLTAPLRIPLFAWRADRRRQTLFAPALRHLLKGYWMGLQLFRRDGSIRKK